MIGLSRVIESLEPSQTLKAAARARELSKQGRDVISFTVGEPDFDTPQHVKDAAVEALNIGFTKYCAVGGIDELKRSIADKMKRQTDLDISDSELIVTNGGKHAIAAACAVLLNPGDEVVIPSPYWTSNPAMVQLAGGVPVYVDTDPENGYAMTGEQLLRACSSKTKLIMLNSPCNPTGGCYTRAQLEEIATAFESLPNKSEIVIMSDEVYEYFTYDGFEHVTFLEAAPSLRENTLLINAFSKTYSMTGWRVGYACGPKEIIGAMTKHQGQFCSNVCSIAQYAAARAYNDHGDFPRTMLAEFTKRREIVCAAFAEIPGMSLEPKPLGAFYAFPDIRGLFGKSAKGCTVTCANDFAEYLLDNFDVVVVQGEAFGTPNGFRLSFALDEKSLRKGLSRIAEAAHSLS